MSLKPFRKTGGRGQRILGPRLSVETWSWISFMSPPPTRVLNVLGSGAWIKKGEFSSEINVVTQVVIKIGI